MSEKKQVETEDINVYKDYSDEELSRILITLVTGDHDQDPSVKEVLEELESREKK